MEKTEINKFIDSMIYDFDTLRYLQDYGRNKETLSIIKRSLDRIRALRQKAEGKDSDLKDLFTDAFWDKEFCAQSTMGEVRNKLLVMAADEEDLDNDLEAIGYTDFTKQLRRWVFDNIYQLRQRTKSSQQKNTEMIIVVLCGCATGLCFFFIFVLNMMSQSWGLKGDFYNDRNFGKWVATGVNKTINFNYYLEMNPHIPHEQNYSARWQGYLLAPKDGNYALSLQVDDGARLYIDDNLLIDAWSDNDSVMFNKNIFLTKGPHNIRLEYYNHLYGIALRLYWKPEGGKKEIIPSYYFRH